MACLRLNGYLLDPEQRQLRDPHGRMVQLRHRRWQFWLSWLAAPEN
jgi:hypothetical protein